MDKAELIIQHLERNLGVDLKKNSNMPQEWCFQFARKYAQYLRATFQVEKEQNGH
jgi:hypothetical protein